MYQNNQKELESIALHRAIKEGNIEEIRKIIKPTKIPLNRLHYNFITPFLRNAIERKQYEALSILLEEEQLSNICYEPLISLLLSCLENSEHKNRVFIEFIEAGLNVNKTILSEEETFLIRAVGNGNFTLVKALVKAGADVNIVSNEGTHALLRAADLGYKEIFDYLVPHTNLELKQEAEIALPKGLIYRARLNDKLTENFTEASLEGDLERVIEALNNKVNVNAFDSDGCTALYLAAITHHPCIVHTLIEAGANVELGEESDGGTPLIASSSDTYLIYPRRGCSVFNIKIRQIEVIKTLIKANGNVNAKTNEGWNALEAAANANNTEVVKLLLSAGANVNARDKRGDTALSRAKRMGNTEIIQILKEAGAKE